VLDLQTDSVGFCNTVNVTLPSRWIIVVIDDDRFQHYPSPRLVLEHVRHVLFQVDVTSSLAARPLLSNLIGQHRGLVTYWNLCIANDGENSLCLRFWPVTTTMLGGASV
jgi:hypothetical protein